MLTSSDNDSDHRLLHPPPRVGDHGPSVGAVGDRLPPRYPGPRERQRDLGHIGDRLEAGAGERRRHQAEDNMFARAGERRDKEQKGQYGRRKDI